jgi:hypothetical protein
MLRIDSNQEMFCNLAMMEAYKLFALYKLCDLMVRVKIRPCPGVVGHSSDVFSGNHGSMSFGGVDREPSETVRSYNQRKKQVFPYMPERSDDLSNRLALAFTALKRADPEQKQLWIAHKVEELLGNAEEARTAYEGKVAAFKVPVTPISNRFGKTKRGRRRKRVKEHGRVSETVRIQVLRYLKNHSDLERAFEEQFGDFRSQYLREPQLLAQAESVWRDNVELAIRTYGMDHSTTADCEMNLAMILHEQKDFEAASEFYERALGYWMRRADRDDRKVTNLQELLRLCQAGQFPASAEVNSIFREAARLKGVQLRESPFGLPRPPDAEEP